jgi:acyl dehydratase
MPQRESDAAAVSAPRADESGLGLIFGAVEDGRALIGAYSPERVGEIEVSLAMIQYYCSAMQDDNPAYWSEVFAEATWDGWTAPPGMLQTWLIPLQWRPEGRQYMTTMVTGTPLPGDKPVNVSTEFEYFTPVRVGDRLTMKDRLIDISDEKTTRVGTGHFITTRAEYHNQRGEMVARDTNILFRYRSPESDAPESRP